MDQEASVEFARVKVDKDCFQLLCVAEHGAGHRCSHGATDILYTVENLGHGEELQRRGQFGFVAAKESFVSINGMVLGPDDRLVHHAQTGKRPLKDPLGFVKIIDEFIASVARGQ